MKTRYAALLIAPLLWVAGGCSGLLVAGGAPGHAFDIPPGHMPPPGQCRIWFPGVPPGQQPPPGDCRELRYQVPPDAYLVYGE